MKTLSFNSSLIISFLAAILLLTGCATSTLETRKQELYTAYAALPAEQQASVDQSKIAVGMNMDAVYIAWGSPAEILEGESSQGSTVTWLYHSTYLQEYHYWTHRGYPHRYGYYSTPYLVYDYQPRHYVRAEVIFKDGKVMEWRSLPQP